MKRKTVLVTGGAGFIGSQTVSELIKRGYKVIVYDNLSTGKKELIHKKAVFFQGDLRNKNLLAGIFAKYKIDAVIHFADLIIVPESVEKPDIYYDNNLISGINLLNCMLKFNVKKIVFSSSACVYAPTPSGIVSEEDKKAPVNPYGRTKLFFEQILEDYDKAYGIKSICLRYFNASGASLNSKIGELREKETHLIPIVLNFLLGKREKIILFGNDYSTKDGTCIRDYIHVVDLANAHIKALKYLDKNKISKKYNAGTGKGHSVLEVIKEIEKITKKKVNFIFDGRRLGDIPILIANPSKIKKELKWKPKYSSLKKIIRTSWKWHKKKISKEF